MAHLRFRHHNNCPRCPLIGAESIPGNEFYEILSLRFNIRIAQDLCRGQVPHLVNRQPTILATSVRVGANLHPRASFHPSKRERTQP